MSESIFDINNNIDNVADIVDCKKWFDKFENTKDFKLLISKFIDELEENDSIVIKKPIPNTYIVYYKKMNDNSLYNWYIKFLVPCGNNSWKIAMIGRTGKVGGRKFVCIYSDAMVADISKVELDMNEKNGYTLPKKYYKIIDIIRERSK